MTVFASKHRLLTALSMTDLLQSFPTKTSILNPCARECMCARAARTNIQLYECTSTYRAMHVDSHGRVLRCVHPPAQAAPIAQRRASRSRLCLMFIDRKRATVSDSARRR